jgi:hypothetical protein
LESKPLFDIDTNQHYLLADKSACLFSYSTSTEALALFCFVILDVLLLFQAPTLPALVVQGFDLSLEGISQLLLFSF